MYDPYSIRLTTSYQDLHLLNTVQCLLAESGTVVTLPTVAIEFLQHDCLLRIEEASLQRFMVALLQLSFSEVVQQYSVFIAQLFVEPAFAVRW